MYREIEGDLIKLALQKEFDVITHGCNCFCIMGAGIAPQMAKAFGADMFDLEKSNKAGDYNKMGQIDYQAYMFSAEKGRTLNLSRKDCEAYFPKAPVLYVVNSYTQYGPGKDMPPYGIPLDYDSLTLCLRKINHEFKGLKLGIPLIGCGLAGGDWNLVRSIIKEEVTELDVTVVHYKP